MHGIHPSAVLCFTAAIYSKDKKLLLPTDCTILSANKFMLSQKIHKKTRGHNIINKDYFFKLKYPLVSSLISSLAHPDPRTEKT